jgi:hypothetical protein
LTGALAHTNDNSTFFESHVIHERFHQVDATAMNGSCIFESRRIRHRINVETPSLVLYSDGDFVSFEAATNVDVFSGILMISVNDGVCERFAHRDLDEIVTAVQQNELALGAARQAIPKVQPIF